MLGDEMYLFAGIVFEYFFLWMEYEFMHPILDYQCKNYQLTACFNDALSRLCRIQLLDVICNVFLQVIPKFIPENAAIFVQ
jgi:hypothetical protein